MKKIVTIVLGVILICIVSHLYNTFFTNKMILGTYINKNYENSPTEPRIEDTLKIFECNNFESKGMGKGVYKVYNSYKGTHIKFYIKDNKYGDEVLNTYITRLWYGEPKIIMDIDLMHYYEKID